MRLHCTAGFLILLNKTLRTNAAWSQSAESAAAATAPLNMVRWTGSLPEAAGRVLEVRFAIYQDQAGGLALWSETQPVKVGADGKYSVLLGSTSAEGLPAALFQAGQARWIEARPVGAGIPETSATPARTLPAAVPYALKSVDSETLAGRPAADYVTREGLQSAVAAGVQAAALPHPETTLTGSGTAGHVPLWTGTTTLGNSVIAETGTSVGIKTATPASTLDVNGTTTLRGPLAMPATAVATAATRDNSPYTSMSGSSFMAGGAAVTQTWLRSS